MSWFLPAQIAHMTMTAILAFVFYYLFWHDRRKYLLLWALSWTSWSLKFLFEILTFLGYQSIFISFLNLASWLAGGILVACGTLTLINKSIPRSWLTFSLLLLLWGGISLLLETNLLSRSLPIFFFLGTIYIQTGILFLRHWEVELFGKHLTGWAFILGGIHIVDYPFLVGIDWFAPWGYLIAAILGFLIGISTLLAYYQKIWQDLSQNEARFRLLAEELSRLHKSRRELLTNISHDLRTPISSIQGYLEALLDGVITEPEEKKHSLALIHQRVLNLNRLIKDLFELTRLESRQVSINYESIGVDKMMREIYERFKFEVKQAGLELIFEDYNPAYSLKKLEFAEVAVDPDRMDQVFGNLISNSIQHTPQGGRIILSCDLAANLKEVEIKVKDTGSGISEADLPHVFNRFYRASQSRTSPTENSGLGLAITKEIIATFGGRIWVQSDINKGSTVYFTLPLCD